MANGLLKETEYFSRSLKLTLRLTLGMIGAFTNTSARNEEQNYIRFSQEAVRFNNLDQDDIKILFNEFKETAPDTLQMLSKQIRASDKGMTKVDYFRAEKSKTPLPKLEGASWASHLSEDGEIDPFKVADAVGLKYADMVSLKHLIKEQEVTAR